MAVGAPSPNPHIRTPRVLILRVFPAVCPLGPGSSIPSGIFHPPFPLIGCGGCLLISRNPCHFHSKRMEKEADALRGSYCDPDLYLKRPRSRSPPGRSPGRAEVAELPVTSSGFGSSCNTGSKAAAPLSSFQPIHVVPT